MLMPEPLYVPYAGAELRSSPVASQDNHAEGGLARPHSPAGSTSQLSSADVSEADLPPYNGQLYFYDEELRMPVTFRWVLLLLR
jgi:hypothetical protein